MSEWLQYIKEHLVPAFGIAAFIIAVAGLLSEFPVVGITAAIFIIAAVIIGGYFVVIIRKKDDEIASLRKQIRAKTPEQKSHAQVSGTYYVKGKNPVNKKKYNGELQIKENGELLEATWVIEPTEEGDAPKQSNGTGLCVDNALAFAFEYSDGRLGCILYEILSDDDMRGKWGLVKETNKDVEECWKKRP